MKLPTQSDILFCLQEACSVAMDRIAILASRSHRERVIKKKIVTKIATTIGAICSK